MDRITKHIKVSSRDNVTTIVQSEGVKKGELIEGIKLLSDIPMGHKMALEDIKSGDPVIRYSEILGYASVDIRKGDIIKRENIKIAKMSHLNELIIGNNLNEIKPLGKRYTFEGYVNDDGSVGTRNIFAIITTVQCVEGVVNVVEDILRKNYLKKFKNIDDIYIFNHNYGCGVAINALNSEIPKRTIKNIIDNPNFGKETLVVGLGCEKLEPSVILDEVNDNNLLILQDIMGFEEMKNTIIEKCLIKMEKLNNKKRQTCDIKDLVVGVQCGGSDALSGLTANPAVGYCVDLLVRGGAKVMFSETSEVRDAAHLMASRIDNEEAGRKMKYEMEWYDNYLATGNVDRDANPAPGNKKGGLINVVDKALGSVCKSGTVNITDVVGPGEKIRKHGLTYAATPASDFVCGTLQFASGMTIQVFTTGRGTTYNLPVAPVIKVSTNSKLKERWFDLIDIDAGRIITENKKIEDIGFEIFEEILKVASGKETHADRHKIYNALCLFNPAPIT